MVVYHEGSKLILTMTNYPKILFITPHAFNGLTGGGITYSNLFKGWPKECLATIHNDIVPTTSDVCDNYYELTTKEIDLIAPLRLLRAVKNKGQAKPIKNNDLAEMETSSPANQKTGVLSKLLGDSIPQVASLSKELEAWILEFKPDMIYTILGNNAMMALISKIKDKFNLPHVVHVMDDWPDSAYQKGFFSRIENYRMRRLVQKLISTAGVRMGICDAMCEKYSKRYAPGFLPFQNTVDIDKWSSLFRKDVSENKASKSFLYVGSIFQNAQLGSLIDCAKSIIELNEAGHSIVFEIASPAFLANQVKHLFPKSSYVRFIDPIDDDATFFQKISKADALLLPVNFDLASIKFIKYSMPTKVPAYMACGTPVLVYGPDGLAQVTYAKEYGWGLVLTNRDSERLKKNILDILNQEPLRKNLMETAQKVASCRHNASTVRNDFQAALLTVGRRQ